MKARILLVSSEFPPGPGGIGHHAWFLAQQLSKYPEIEIQVVAPADNTTDEKRNEFDRIQPFKVYRFKRLGIFTYVLRIIKLSQLLLKNRYTHFWSSGKFSLWLVWVQKFLNPRAKTMCILHGTEVNLSNKYLRILTHQSIFQFQTIVSVSNFTESLLPDWILKRHHNRIIIPNGLEMSDFNGTKSVELKGNPSLLTVGHVSPRKGQHRMIKGLSEVLKQFPETVYHIVGIPLDQEKLENLANEHGVRDKVVFHGAVSEHADLWSYYFASNIFVLLSENQPNGDVEGFGIVALEANAMGKPVIGAKFCGVEDAVNNYVSGVLVDGDNHVEITEAVKFCVDNKKMLEETSRKWAIDHGWDRISQRFMELV